MDDRFLLFNVLRLAGAQCDVAGGDRRVSVACGHSAAVYPRKLSGLFQIVQILPDRFGRYIHAFDEIRGVDGPVFCKDRQYDIVPLLL